MSYRLYCICVKQGPIRMGDSGKLLDRLDGADFVVGQHDGDQDSVRPQRIMQDIGLDLSLRIYRQQLHLEALLAMPVPGMKNSVMLNSGDENMLAPAP